MQSEDRIRLAHMREAAREAIMFVVGRKRGDLDDDRMLLLALVKCIEILGEAGSKVSAQAQLEAPEIPWRSIVAMRNRLIHGYFDIDVDIVWQTVSSELPPLIAAMTALLERD